LEKRRKNLIATSDSNKNADRKDGEGGKKVKA